jgi:hypothetical protein
LKNEKVFLLVLFSYNFFLIQKNVEKRTKST